MAVPIRVDTIVGMSPEEFMSLPKPQTITVEDIKVDRQGASLQGLNAPIIYDDAATITAADLKKMVTRLPKDNRWMQVFMLPEGHAKSSTWEDLNEMFKMAPNTVIIPAGGGKSIPLEDYLQREFTQIFNELDKKNGR